MYNTLCTSMEMEKSLKCECVFKEIKLELKRFVKRSGYQARLIETQHLLYIRLNSKYMVNDRFVGSAYFA